MATRSKRYASSRIESGRVILPRRLAFLRGEKFIALIEREVDGKQEWYVELTSAATKDLFHSTSAATKALAQSKAKELEDAEIIDKLSSTNELLEKKIRNQDAQIFRCNEEIKTLERNNQQLLKNMEEGNAAGKYPRSKKSLLNVAIERDTNFASKPFQGGLAGINKK